MVLEPLSWKAGRLVLKHVQTSFRTLARKITVQLTTLSALQGAAKSRQRVKKKA